MTSNSHQYNSKYILALSFISALGGYLFGFDFAVISGALPFLKDKFNLNEYWEGFATGSLALGAIVGCIVAGIGVGMASMLSPLYIGEIAPAHFRGRMVAINQLTIVLGILITNIINYTLRNEGDDAWRWMFGLGAIPSLLFFIGVLWLPESPRWLSQKNKLAQAKIILERIGGKEFGNTTIAEMQRSVQPVNKLKFSV